MIGVVMRRDNGIESDRFCSVVLDELPVHEVRRVFPGLLHLSRETAVHEHVAVIRRADQHAVTLSHVDEIELEQRLAAEFGLPDIAFPAASLHFHVAAAGA